MGRKLRPRQVKPNEQANFKNSASPKENRATLSRLANTVRRPTGACRRKVHAKQKSLPGRTGEALNGFKTRVSYFLAGAGAATGAAAAATFLAGAALALAALAAGAAAGAAAGVV